MPAYSWQHTIADLVTAMARAGLVLETLHEYPYSNGSRVHASLVPAEGRRWVWPEGLARVRLMAGFVARRPGRLRSSASARARLRRGVTGRRRVGPASMLCSSRDASYRIDIVARHTDATARCGKGRGEAACAIT